MDIVIDIAFVVAVTAFIREQFNLSGVKVLVIAFAVTLGFNLAPLIGEVLPALTPWLDALLKTFWLFVVSAGSVDAVRYFVGKRPCSNTARK
jgi:hypothetical protein